MERLKLILAVAGCGLGERMGAALERAGCAVCFHLSGQGTAKTAWLELLACLIRARTCSSPPAPKAASPQRLTALRAEAGETRYFAAAIPLSGIAGRDAYEKLAQEGTRMERAFELIVAIVNRGFSDLVMDAARKAGASGGTILHGRWHGRA